MLLNHPLWRKYQAASMRLRWGIPLGVASLGLLGLMVWLPYRTAQTPPPPALPNAYDFTGLDPATLAGLTGGESAEEVARNLSGILAAYDVWLQGQYANVMDYPIARESERLIQEAKKEAANARIDFTEPVGDLDLSSCVEQLQPYQCVLLRYAGDGIQKANRGLQEDDAYLIAEGVIRYHAAMRGLFPLEFRRFGGDEMVRGMTGLRFAAMQLKVHLPAAQSPVNTLLLSPTTTPADAIQEAME